MKTTIENTNNNVITDEFIKGLTLECFNHAVETMSSDENIRQTVEYTKMYFGTECEPGSHGFTLMQGFLWGMAEYSRIVAAMDDNE